MFFNQGQLQKMTIRAYRPTTRQDEVPQISDAPTDSYVVQVNPSGYALAQTIQYAEKQAQGASATDAVFSRSPARELNFTFLFDATGVIPPPPSALTGIPLVGALASALSDDEPYIVADEIEKFSSVVYNYSGEMHRPRRVLLLWGALSFSCVLTSLNFEFKLFRPDGTPLRATAACTFRESIPEVERELKEANSSPDLTHIRQVRAGDTLPLMTHEVYGDARHYLEVARHNKIVNFRRLNPGSQLQLPKLAKEAVA